MLKRSITYFGLAAVLFVALSLEAVAQTPPSTFSYQGRVYQSDGVTPVNAASVIFTISIYAPDGVCLLYQETQVRNMSSTAGMFSFNVGSGTNSGVSSLTLVQAFDNLASKVGASGCTYTPAAGDSRRLRFSYYDGSSNVTMPSDQIIQSVPFAWTSNSVQGFVPSQFVQTSAITTQAEVDAVFTNYTQLMSLINGTSSTYAKSSDLPISGGTLNLSSGGVIVPTTPATTTSAVNEAYADGHLGGKVLNLTGLASGETLVWNGSTNNWQVAALNSGTVTSINAGTGLSGGTITGTGTISLSTTGTVGTYTKVTTDAYGRVSSGGSLANTDIPAPTGDVNGTFAATTVARIQGVNVSSAAPTSGQVLKYNSSTSQWEPNADNSNSGTVSSVVAGAGLSGGTITTTGTISLPATGTAGTYTKITTDSYGRVTAGANVNASDLKNTYGVSQMPNTTCTASTTLTYLVPSDTYTCTPIAILSSQVTGLGSVASMSVGTTAGTVAAGNDSRITGALQSSGTAGGDLSGTYSSPTVAKINGVALSSAAPSNGQVLEFNSSTSQWTPTTISTASGTITSITAGTGLSGGTITSSGTIALASTGTAGTYTKITTDAYGRVSSGSALANTDIPAPTGDVSGTYSATVVSKVQGVAVASTAPTNGQVLEYNSSTSQWTPTTISTSSGTVTSITAGSGLSGGTITGSGTISLPSVGTAGTYAKVTTDAYGRVSSGAALTSSDIPTPAGDISGTYAASVVSKVQGVAVASTAPTNGQVLQYNSTTTQWAPTTLSMNAGTVTSIVAGTGLSGGTITGSGTIALASTGTAGTYTKVTTDAYGRVSSGAALASTDIPAPAGDVTGTYAAMTVSKLNGVSLSSTAPAGGQVLQYNSTTSQWTPATPTSGTITSITAGAGLSGGTITGSGTIALPTVGTAGTYSKVTVDAYGRVSGGANVNATDLKNSYGTSQMPNTLCTASTTLVYLTPTDTYTCTSIAITASQVSGLGGAASLSVGTTTGTIAAGDDSRIVGALQSTTSTTGDLSGTYGSTTVAKIRGVAVASTAPASGQVLAYNSGTSSWTPTTPNAGTVTSITAGSGLSGGTITGSGTISLPATGTAGTYTKVTTDAYGRVSSATTLSASDIPAPAGDVTGTFAAMSVVKLNGVALSTTAPTNGQMLAYNSSTSQWTATTPNAGTVTSITAGTGLTGGTITSSGTVAVNVGTSANQIPQLDSSARLPAVDGSQLVNLPIPFSNATVVNTTGSGSFTVPANVTKLYVQVWGGGGGGAGGTALSVAGTGGAAGGYSSGYVTVTAGASISYSVGTGGSAGAVAGDGTAGGASNFSTYFTAAGGAKGSASVNSPTVGGAGGGTSGIITVTGGGGNGAGAYVVGLGSQGGSGGHAGGGGGAGGGGSGSSSYGGGAGSAPGGGGGGGASTVTSGSAGGAGAAGRIIIWY